MKKRNLFSNKNRHIKNKNYLRKKNKYFTDQKFLRKFKKFAKSDEPKKELVRSDPIKNFFFTPNHANQDAHAGEENTEEGKEEEQGTDIKSANGDDIQEDQREDSPIITKHNNGITHSLRGNKTKGSATKKKNSPDESQQHPKNDSEDETQTEHQRKNHGRHGKSVYSKEINIVSMKRKERELYLKEKEAAIQKSEQEKKKKKMIRIKKFKKLNKKTKKGQPVMKNLINHLLKKI
ncbi:conserved Plasmodium protein, unknown function [Plasmodium knowlesi strain H]|uniref:Uncharacterized protein n=3 Tax=Plasmodium knowlesi TaxID=5850 RepID=A0A5K1VF91_PLAKH|nr:rRNA-processing protein, putative [Plasmodium knowlesi strain H]OTN63656.1 Uncharacterized protein PKNOH_S140262800 [Plasmodium knowlesi]CAA9991043.1 rRNA-processing protein, putative [Plasmodium knowlesi strain H]SBO20673.1 conserved Plasmodium protein, unknown function [Plasmodium knowlesi strain H]SBO21102.1 conserved Plasmodium protein, unknown function [Plasmodium knowlesi strain H]VVS80517.1 rRNA-processing protein, putative [Plasmodium knowlesi strain H]|eukprot:XP_002262325.1 hypothetical protein, conserved in Plasmodium species [Plasmodium knowlesi strain H]